MVSPSNTVKQIKAKAKEYLFAGVRLVWIVDPEDRTVTVITDPLESRTLEAEATLEALGYARRPDAEQGADYHTIFTARGVDVELHRDLGERHASRLDVETVWSS